LTPQGNLTRNDRLVPETERRLLGQSQALGAGIAGRLAGISQLQGRADPLFDRASGFFDQTQALRDILTPQLARLRPGQGDLTESRVGGVRAARGKAVGGIRDAFNKRAVLGSNFAQKEIAAQIRDFAEVEDRIRAESFIQEMQAQEQLVNDIGNLLRLDQASLQSQAQAIGVQLGLNESEGQVFSQSMQNIQQQLAVTQSRMTRELQELGAGGNIINGANAIAAQVATAQAKLEAEAAAARGQSFSDIFTGLGPIAGFALAGPLGGAAASGLKTESFRSIFGLPQPIPATRA
jgi:hypothetical protein